MRLEKNVFSITCILPKAKALDLLKCLRDEKNITQADFFYARGFDVFLSAQSGDKRPSYDEKEVVSVLAQSEKEADDLFAYIYEKAEVNRSGGGFIYMTSVATLSHYSLPVEINESKINESGRSS